MVRTNRRAAQAARPPGASSPPAAVQGGGDLIDMDEAIALLSTTRPTFYRWLRAGRIRGTKVGRQWRFTRADLDRFLRGHGPQIDLPADLDPLLETLAGRLREAKMDVPAPADDSPSARLDAGIDRLLRFATKTGASDVHIEPENIDGRPEIRVRWDGLLHPIATFDVRLLPSIVERIKSMARCDVHERTLPQDGRIETMVEGQRVMVSVTVVPAFRGESVALRLLRRDSLLASLDLATHPYAPADMRRIREALAQPMGLTIVTGPSGCGKTTSLYAMMLTHRNPGVKLMSVEDPVEIAIPGVVQVSLRPGMTFPSVLRAFQRSDPNVVGVGEIRDGETMQLVLNMALTGHGVLATLHTEDAAAAIVRMVDAGGAPASVADATRLVVAQRLVRVLCPDCTRPADPPPHRLEQAARMARTGGLPWDTIPHRFQEPVGCPKCHNAGYRGRTLIAETMAITPELAGAIRRGAGAPELRTLAVGQGMTTMAADGLRRAAEGKTTIDEVMRVLSVAE